MEHNRNICIRHNKVQKGSRTLYNIRVTEMNSEEYAEILRFLSFQEYPLYILQLDGKKLSHGKSNFRRQASNYQVCERKLFKVSD